MHTDFFQCRFPKKKWNAYKNIRGKKERKHQMNEEMVLLGLVVAES